MLNRFFRCFISLIPCFYVACSPAPPFSDSELAKTVSNGQVLIELKPALSGKLLEDVSWDNIQGRFLRESKTTYKIGFEKPVQPQFGKMDVLTLSEHARQAVGMETERIIVPFGAMLTKTINMIKQENYPNLNLCFETDCPKLRNNGKPYESVITLEVDQFLIWEFPAHNINLYGRLSVKHKRINQPDNEFWVERALGYKVVEDSKNAVGQLFKYSSEFSIGLMIQALSSLKY
jgi:hypothetical protein